MQKKNHKIYIRTTSWRCQGSKTSVSTICNTIRGTKSEKNNSLLWSAGEALRMVPCAAPLRMALEPRETTLDSIMVETNLRGQGEEEGGRFLFFAANRIQKQNCRFLLERRGNGRVHPLKKIFRVRTEFCNY